MADEEQSRLSAREVDAEYAAGTAFDITECTREPIHLLGSVQSHGALLALAEPGLTVEVASANTAALLGVAPETLLGLPVADIFGAEQARQLGEAVSDGLVPDLPGLPALLARLPSVSVGQAWSTHRLGEELGELAQLSGDCAGMLLVPLTSSGDVLAWFRGEVSRTVRWAADPGRPVVTGSRGQRLTPRGSSSVWQQTVRGQSLPWSGQEHAIAEETYRVLFEVAARRAAALSAGHAELARSDDELEAFAQAALHDLKEPLRGIARHRNPSRATGRHLPDLPASAPLGSSRWRCGRGADYQPAHRRTPWRAAMGSLGARAGHHVLLHALADRVIRR